AHIQVSNYDENNSYENKPIDRNDTTMQAVAKLPGIRHMQVFATKAGIIKTKDEIQGVVAKGIGSDFDWNYFRSRLTEGRIFSIQDSVKSDAVLISANISEKLDLHAGDNLVMYFIQQPP